MDRGERDRQAEQRARGLSDLVDSHLPLEVRAAGPADAWALVGPALLARQVGAVEAIFRLHPSGRDAESIILLRSLFDHVVSFAWLAADPRPERHRQFLKSDSAARLKAADDCLKVGVEILTAEKRAEYQRHLDELPSEMPPLLERADQADKHWTGKIEGMGGADSTHSYRGLYAIAYRRHSAVDHASLMGLNPVIVDLADGRKRVQPRNEILRNTASTVSRLCCSRSVCSQQLKRSACPTPPRCMRSSSAPPDLLRVGLRCGVGVESGS